MQYNVYKLFYFIALLERDHFPEKQLVKVDFLKSSTRRKEFCR